VTRREEYDRRQRRRSIAIATVSTVVVVVAVVTLVPRPPGWDDVQRSFFDGETFRDTFPRLLEKFWLDVKIFAWSAPSILVLGTLIALSRNVRSPALFPLRMFGAVYTDVFRGVPVLLTIYLIGFGVPGLGLPRPWNSPLLWGSVALILAYSAYVAEVLRSGIQGVHESQRAAARSLGMSGNQTMRAVVLPQAFRRVVPPLMNDFISLQKDVALISVIGPVEILRQAEKEKNLAANFTPYVGAALIFLAVTIPLTRIADHLLARQMRRTGPTAIA
jgi:polar amino acid transport system permease protein